MILAMGTQTFKMTTWNDDAVSYVEITGGIDEYAQFGEVRLMPKIAVDLKGVTALNSVGTRAWCLWIQRFRAPTEVILDGCPAIVVKSFTSVKGFLTDRCLVRSFVIPFYSDVSGESLDFLAVRGNHFDAVGRLNLPEIKDSSGNPMEMDVVPEQYLSFFKR